MDVEEERWEGEEGEGVEPNIVTISAPSYKEIQQHEIPWYLNSLSHLSFACFIYFCLATTQKQQLLLLLSCPRQSLLMQK